MVVLVLESKAPPPPPVMGPGTLTNLIKESEVSRQKALYQVLEVQLPTTESNYYSDSDLYQSQEWGQVS